MVNFFLIIVLSLSSCQIFASELSQSDIQNEIYKSEAKALGSADDWATLKKIWSWKRRNFRGRSAGGKLIGKLRVDDILSSRKISGCHDDALLFVSVLKELKIPSVMLDATGIKWAKDFIQRKKIPYEGHVFLEIKLNKKWILFDPASGHYIKNYDRSNPVIPINHGTQNQGYYVMVKGSDSWDHGIRSLSDLKALQRKTAKSIDFSKIKTPLYKIERL